MPSPVKLLIVDDDQGHRNALLNLLGKLGYLASGAESGENAVIMCKTEPFALILMDVRMTGISGIEAMREILAYNPAIPVLIMTAYSDVSNAVQALKSGAYDYLTKPLDFDDLRLAIERALEHSALKAENKTLQDALSANLQSNDMIGQSRAMRNILNMIKMIAPSNATVLITGESGTGKEVAARLIHANGNRRKEPFIAVNCGAFSETLLESELFGHEKGAFTGAERRREGRIASADKGTIFLDEIGEMPQTMQVKLLRVIQERELQRLGGDKAVKVDVRIVAATNRELEEEVKAGRFRQDLFYRLNVVNMRMPTLRERTEDIPLLAAHFLKLYAERNAKIVKGFTPYAMDRLVRYSWPGNVRELENTLERAVVLLMGDYISERELPPTLMEGEKDSLSIRHAFGNLTLEEIERTVVRDTLEEVGGNKSEAARRLGINRKTLLSKLQ
jgi:two-component system response regulator HydG